MQIVKQRVKVNNKVCIFTHLPIWETKKAPLAYLFWKSKVKKVFLFFLYN